MRTWIVAMCAMLAAGRFVVPARAASSEWRISTAPGCSIALRDAKVDGREAVGARFTLLPSQSWVEMRTSAPAGFDPSSPVAFWIQNEASITDLEIKLVAKNGSVFGRKTSLKGQYAEWTRLVVDLHSLEYWWGGNGKLDLPADFALAVSGTGSGAIFIANVALGEKGTPLSFAPAGPMIDPNADLAGYSFAARRSRTFAPEDPLVLEYLKRVQDTSSPERALVPAQEDNSAQTFNNALVAMAFTLKEEKERAQRILDFYAKATVKTNDDQRLQNFFYKGEARGFFQNVTMRKSDDSLAYRDVSGSSDRWMGDMAWLLLACNFYDKQFSSERYSALSTLLYDLLVAWFKEDGADGGYVQHGWRKGDKYLHESSGHEEGNLDCHAAFLLMGDTARAARIKTWETRQLQARPTLPLDLYTWRVLAFGKEACPLLDIPERDLRYRKTVTFNGKPAAGFYTGADPSINNVWLDGLGHIACAEFACGNSDRGAFYANQMDSFLIARRIGGVLTKALPYAANQTGVFDWVDTSKGFTSACAWYIFAKNKFNPMTLDGPAKAE